MNSDDFISHSKKVRRHIIDLAYCSGAPHVGSALSCADILSALYMYVLRLDDWANRDIFILSKAHAATALYSVLFEKGLMSKEQLAGYFQDNGTLPAHLDRNCECGIEVSAGSLGHGFNIGLGMAYGFLRQGMHRRRVFILIGDGESQEGSIWEGALFASHMRLENVTVIIDRNNLQGYGRVDDVCHLEPLKKKWESFGWETHRCDGHDGGALLNGFEFSSRGKPKVIIADTIKGKGISFMEDRLIWHYYIVTKEHHLLAMKELI